MINDPMSVLLVEDDPLLLQSAAAALEDAGCTVVRAGSHKEAFSKIEDGFEPTVLITDVVMPGEKDGLELARQVRERCPKVRVLIVSGQQRPDPADCPDGAVFFTKPFPPAGLVAMAIGENW